MNRISLEKNKSTFRNSPEINSAWCRLEEIYNQAIDFYRPNPEQTLDMIPLFGNVIPLANKIVSHHQSIQQTLTLSNLLEVEQVKMWVNWFGIVYKQIIDYKKPGFQMLQQDFQFCEQANKLRHAIDQLVPVMERNTCQAIGANM